MQGVTEDLQAQGERATLRFLDGVSSLRRNDSKVMSKTSQLLPQVHCSPKFLSGGAIWVSSDVFSAQI